MKVLYVDDDDEVRLLVELCLQMDDEIELRAVQSGAAALSILDDTGWRPDALLLDVMMPQMDGPALLAAVRSREAFMDTPAIFITASVLPKDIETLMAMGARGVIIKPFDPLTLSEEVRKILDGA